MRALVTGATGFIGSQLVNELATAGHQVAALVRDPSRAVHLPAELVRGDIAQRPGLPALDGYDVVFHLASLLKVPWKPEFHTVNRDGTANVAAACADAERPPVLVLMSSMAAAGPSTGAVPRGEDEPPRPVSIYGRVKLAAEAAALRYSRRVEISVVRSPAVFGEGDRAVLTIFRSVLKGWHLVPAPGTQRLGMVHVTDLARGLMRVAESGERHGPAPGCGIYQIAAPEAPTYGELGDWIARALSCPPPRALMVPRPITWLGAALGEAYARIRDQPSTLNLDKYKEAVAGSWTCSSEKATETLGWRPALPLADRLQQTAAWYRQQGWLA